jgi:MFS family permease
MTQSEHFVPPRFWPIYCIKLQMNQMMDKTKQLQRAAGGSLQYMAAITFVATLGGLLFGYDTAVISGTVSSLKVVFINPYNWPETVANSWHGFLVSSALIGCIIGGLTGGLVSLKLGRKRGLILAAILFLISAIGSAMPEMFFQPIGTADHTFMAHFIVYRIIGGIGVGLASMLSPMYIAEISPAKIRGKLVSWNQFAIIFGTTASPGKATTAGSIRWDGDGCLPRRSSRQSCS